MGNTESSVTSGVKAQANAVVEIYSLVDLNGGGELVELMKKANKAKEYGELDETIRSKIPKYVYGGGEGKCMPIHRLVLRRNKERPPSKEITPPKNLPDDDSVAGKYIPRKMSPDKTTDHTTYRYVCWDLQHVGAVGESVLHLCVLNATSVHNDLAKRLIRHFPNLINDIYLCDEYYGENVLHIAIVNEDPAMVKFLLDNGANYHERCLGNFMCAEDQKTSRMDSLEHEWVDLCQQTNYEGYVYWGEYPLSFAACLGQEECYRLILAKGANPDLQDTNGNTVTHMMVIYDKMDMFDMCFEAGATISIRNRQGLIPLSLAAILAHRDIFFHILNIEREIYWQIGNITCAAYPLEYLDTINVNTGETQTKSALNLIAYGDKEAHLDLMEGPIVDLLKTKWETFVKKRFNNLFLVFLAYFLVSLVAYVSRPMPCVSSSKFSSKSHPLSIMQLPALNITCVNVSVHLHPDMVIEDPTVTTDPTFGGLVTTVTNATNDYDFTTFTSRVTSQPEEEEDLEDFPPLLLAAGEDEGEDDEVVTRPPEDAVTVQYLVEGETTPVTLGSGLNDLLNASATADSLSSTPRPPLVFTCHNKTHYLHLTAHNASLFITKIIRRAKYSKAPKAMVAVNPYDDSNSTNNTSNEDPCYCALWKTPAHFDGEIQVGGYYLSELQLYVRLGCEAVTLFGSLAYLVGAANEARFQGAQMFVENLSTVPSRVLFLLSCMMVLGMACFRALCMNEAEDVLAVLVMLSTGPYFLFFCRGFKTVGPFVTMIYTMLVGDLLRFVTIYFVFIMGFSQAYFIIFNSFHDTEDRSQCVSNPMPNAPESVMKMFIMSLGNFGDSYSALDCTDHDVTGKILFLVFMAIVSLLLINLLIAMMGNTYERIAEMKNEWMRQWARIVLVVERGISPEERLKHLMNYSQPMSDGRRALVLRLHQNDEEREEMKDILDMKRVHNKYVLRRKNRKDPYADSGDPTPRSATPANPVKKV
ncbi:transient receptor potential cation channel subfamily V member 5-like [Eriocheir sinensis]|uniref:transient receptor potential cation channel subfamily V member 5-like n=1 Tax=Eriocheir sinensis TaxID=95602 RepID=UPI0021C91BD4|nr:transient receptor potential cation channel subfamily V member 5-like [Eriocheir sinensis]